MAVGPRERVVLIEVSGQLIMVGVAPGQVRGLAQFPLPVEGTPASEGSVVMPSSDDDDVAAGNDFKRLLNQFQSRRKSGPDQSAP